MSDLDKEFLRALKITRSMQQWRVVRAGHFVLNTGASEKGYSLAEVAEMLNIERAALEVKAGVIQHALDLYELEEKQL